VIAAAPVQLLFWFIQPKINLVNEFVIAVFAEKRRESVKEIFVQFPTLDVVLGLDKDLSKKVGGKFSLEKESQRIVAILLALKDLKAVTFVDRGCETWFYFDPKENLAKDVLQIKLRNSEMKRAVKISRRILPALEKKWRSTIH
jgi:hypothetical protein